MLGLNRLLVVRFSSEDGCTGRIIIYILILYGGLLTPEARLTLDRLRVLLDGWLLLGRFLLDCRFFL